MRADHGRRRPRLGSVLLAAVLLGVPRALDARAFGSTPAFYVEVSAPSPGLRDFADALSRAIEEAGGRLSRGPRTATVVVEVHGLWRGPRLGRSESIAFTVRDARGQRPLLLDYKVGHAKEAAAALLRALDPRA
jgi:hypothetical protein